MYAFTLAGVSTILLSFTIISKSVSIKSNTKETFDFCPNTSASTIFIIRNESVLIKVWLFKRFYKNKVFHDILLRSFTNTNLCGKIKQFSVLPRSPMRLICCNSCSNLISLRAVLLIPSCASSLEPILIFFTATILSVFTSLALYTVANYNIFIVNCITIINKICLWQTKTFIW